MPWRELLQFISEGLGISLVCRLLFLRLHNVYRVFCAFVAWDVLSSAIALLAIKLGQQRVDYRLVWIPTRVVNWVFSLWMVYALLDAILTKYPSFRRFSRKFLNWVFVLALCGAAASARQEYLAYIGRYGTMNFLGRLTSVVTVSERTISTAAALVLILTCVFILWFPVQMPRNLAIFSIGFIVYFSAKTVLLLCWVLVSEGKHTLVSDSLPVLLSVCYLYWIVLLNRAGELAPVVMGHRWNEGEQRRLIRELEAMNSALARTPRNPKGLFTACICLLVAGGLFPFFHFLITH